MIFGLFKKVSTYSRKPFLFKILFVVSWCLLGLSRIVILIVKFKRVARIFGATSNLAPQIPVISEEQESRAKTIGQAVRTAAGYTPWNSNCFPQALSAVILLRLFRVPYSLFFGVKNEATDGSLIAHCWIASGRIAVTGGRPFHKYAVVGTFLFEA